MYSKGSLLDSPKPVTPENYMKDGGRGTEYEKEVTAFITLSALEKANDFWLINNASELAPFDDIILCTRENSEIITYLFQVKLGSNFREKSELKSEYFTNKKFELPELYILYEKYLKSIGKIKKIIPESYSESCKFKIIIFTNRQMEKNSAIFNEVTDCSFSTNGGKAYKFKEEFVKREVQQFSGFLESINVYANQWNVGDTSKIRIKKYLKTDDITAAEIKYDYFTCIQNWCESRTIKNRHLTKEFVYKLLMYSTFKNYLVTLDNFNETVYVKYQEILPENYQDMLWKSMKNNNMSVSCDHIQYVLGRALEDFQHFTAHIDDRLIYDYDRIISTRDEETQSQKQLQYYVGCLLGKLPFIVQNFNLPIESRHCEVVFIYSNDQNKVINEEMLRALEQLPITTKSGQNFSISDIIGKISYEAQIHDLYALIFNNNNKIHKNEVFVDRRISKVLLDKAVFTCSNDIFIVILNNITSDKFIAYFNVNSKDVFISESQFKLQNYKYNLTEQNCFNVTASSGINVHVVKLHGKQSNNILIEWVRTIGSISNIRHSKIYEILEDEGDSSCYAQLEKIICKDSLTIISGDAGVGKSTLLNKFIQTAPPDDFILLVNLIDHYNYFENYQEGSRVEDLLNYFCKIENIVFKSLFKRKAKEKKIIILFDGFDEISPKFAESVSKIIKQIREDGHKIILTTRSMLKNQVENLFDSFALSLNEFNEVERQIYFEKFADSSDCSNFLNISKYTNIQDYFNIPLHLKLISEIIVYEKNKINDLENLFKINQLQLYENYINYKLEVYRNKDKPIIERHHKYFAIKKLFNASPNYFLIKDSLDKTLHYNFSGTEETDLFIHRTVSEYFVAKWLVEFYIDKVGNIKGEEEFAEFAMKTIILSKIGNDFNIYRDDVCFPYLKLFFDQMINTDDLHKAAIEGNYKYINEQFDSDISLVKTVNKFNRTLLHTILLKNEQFYNKDTLKIDKDLIKIVNSSLSKSFELFRHKDSSNKSAEDYVQLKKAPLTKLVVHDINEKYFVYLVRDFELWEIFCPDLFYKSHEILLSCENDQLFKIQDAAKNGSLHFAAKTADLTLMKCLIEFNNANTKNSVGQTPLHMAVQFGNLEMVKLLMENGADNIVDNNKSTSLHIAAKNGTIDILEYLIKTTTNVNIRNKFGATPLHYAVQQKLEIVKFLIETGADYNCVDNEGYTILHYATKAGFTDTIAFLIKLGADLNAKNRFGATPLHIAARENLNALKFLTQFCADLQNPNNEGFTPLHYAVNSENVDIIDFLLRRGVNINAKSCFGTTPLHQAVMRGNLDVVKLLISNGAELNTDNEGATCLHYATKIGIKDLIQYLIEYDHNVNNKNNIGLTPLHMAILSGKLEIVKILITEGADPTLVDNYGFGCLHFAADYGFRHLAEYLISLNLNVNAGNKMGVTPLHYAVKKNLETVEFLINNNADEYITDCTDDSCLHYATKGGSVDIINYLIERKHNINAMNYVGHTPLHMAVEAGKLDIVKFLIKKGADPNIKDKNGFTCLGYAVKAGHKDIIDFLNHIFKYIL